jgi:hypothetical protein
MHVLFEGAVAVAYHILAVVSGGDTNTHDQAFAGQSNGLCGAGVPGLLSLITAPHSSHIPVRVELFERRSPLLAACEEVVEVSFTPASSEVALQSWDGDVYPLDLPVQSYRVRYHLDQMDGADEREVLEQPNWHTHVLQFWPAPPAPDKVLRVKSDAAAYWHSVARKMPPPPTSEGKAEAERKQAEQRRQQEEQ